MLFRSVVLPHGVLFRGSAEGVIRKYLIEQKNVIDAVIGLPPNLFYGTQIATCVLMLKKNREQGEGIFFINAGNEFEKIKTKNTLNEQQLRKIADTYRHRSEIEKYSHCATLQEIRDNDFNLNIPRYVDTFEEKPEINIEEVMDEISRLEAKRIELDKEIGVYLRELGLKK